MRNHRCLIIAWIVVTGALATGCALTKKSPPLQVRYFTPESAAQGAPPEALSSDPPMQLRLGRVNAASYIRDKIVYRRSAHELGYHDLIRWTEDPESYVRRALTRDLFQAHGLRQTLSGPGLTLEVDLEIFEERRVPRRTARVQLTWRLRNDKVVLIQRTVTVERDIKETRAVAGEEVAVAMAGALGQALDEIVGDVIGELAAQAGPVPAPATVATP